MTQERRCARPSYHWYQRSVSVLCWRIWRPRERAHQVSLQVWSDVWSRSVAVCDLTLPVSRACCPSQSSNGYLKRIVPILVLGTIIEDQILKRLSCYLKCLRKKHVPGVSKTFQSTRGIEKILHVVTVRTIDCMKILKGTVHNNILDKYKAHSLKMLNFPLFV